MHWYIDVLKNYVGFEGRAHRTEFWMFVLISIIVSIVISIIGSILGIKEILGFLYNLAIMLPALAVGSRRLHDTDRSAWWLLLYLIPFLGWIVLLIFYCIDSTPGANKYGPNPKGEGV